MPKRIAVIGAGVSGLTCAILLLEHGYSVTILAEEMGPATTSAAAGAIWFPYDVEPLDKAIRWALQSYHTFRKLEDEPHSGVSMIELRQFCRAGNIAIPDWGTALGAARLDSAEPFETGFGLNVPLMDTSVYLPYLTDRFASLGGLVRPVHINQLEDVPLEFSMVINCAGIGAGTLVPDRELEPHRGQVVIVPKLNLAHALVCDDAPLMYAIPRTNDCLFGGTNEVSDNRQPDPETTAAIVNECSRVLNIPPPHVLAERVGLRPFRRTGVRLEADRLGDGRPVIHNYGHGGSGFTLSWGCGEEVLGLISQHASR
jgi:D-amino-acid oxidase